VQVAEQRWAGEGREARVTLDLEPVPTVLGNAEELRHALDHLLQNAREASETGAPVTLRLHWDGGSRVELAVVDEGRGMDAATAVRAVEPFFTTKGPGRLGVGLAITRATATRHRGELQIDSRPGRGTTVKVQLPVAPGAARAAGGGAAGRPAGARVLVVEDEPDVREVLVQGLAQDGATVRIADDVRAALALLESTPIDAAVIDLMLPGGSGLEVSRQTRRLHPGASIILMTGWPGRVDPHTLEAHGVDAVVEKPVGLDALRAILAGLLARSGPRPD
jgi:CheY-like chemotaxis protein/anti-sigma regulatory factor (Ser/Thr protein kinase)